MRRTRIFYDWETTGLTDAHPNSQLAAIAVDQDYRELETYEAKLQFDEALADPEALRINHYSRERWANAKPEAQAMSELRAFVNRHKSVECVSRAGKPYQVARLAGHNVIAFDKPRLGQAWARAFGEGAWIPIHHLQLDTLQRALWWAADNGIDPEPASFKLGLCLKMMGLDPPDGPLHDALNDCRASIAIAKFCAGLSR